MSRICQTRGSTLDLSPGVLQGAKLGYNYTLLLSVETREAGTGTLIANEGSLMTLRIMQSRPVIKIVSGDMPSFCHLSCVCVCVCVSCLDHFG